MGGAGIGFRCVKLFLIPEGSRAVGIVAGHLADAPVTIPFVELARAIVARSHFEAQRRAAPAYGRLLGKGSL